MQAHANAGSLNCRRRQWLVRAGMPLLACIARYHRIQVEGAAHLPQKGPALLLAKHRATRDTLLLAWLLHRYTGRTASYVMKRGAAGLPPRLMEAFGGIPVIRAKDVLRLQSRAEREAYLTKARTRQRAVRAHLAGLYARGEIVVVYPEGMFYPERLGPLDGGAIRQVYALHTESALAIPIIPIGIEYRRRTRLRSQAVFRIGSPQSPSAYATPAEMMAAFRDQLISLSGLR